MEGLFITGTDTGVGKTMVTAGLVRALRTSGGKVLPFKPVQTGCTEDHDGTLRSPDMDLILDIAGIEADGDMHDLLCPFRYPVPCSPHLAAELQGTGLSVDGMCRRAEMLSERCDFVVAEGAGGVLVPLNRSETMLDLMAALGWSVVLVARAGLGTINHSLLSLRCLADRGLKVEGVVMVHHSGVVSPVTINNPSAIERFGGFPVLTEVPFVSDMGRLGEDMGFASSMLELEDRLKDDQ